MSDELDAGKIPQELLSRFLDTLPKTDSTVLIGPRVGEDVAAVDVSSEEILILKSDPITFTAKQITEYAVVINANDIATSGATPRWMLPTLLVPVGFSRRALGDIFTEAVRVCERYNISLVGGHSEVTAAVNQPVLCGSILGLLSVNGRLE